MSDVAPKGDFRRMAPVAVQIAQQILDQTRDDTAYTDDDMTRDLADLAAHILTIPLDRETQRGGLVAAIERFRDTFRKAVAHENLGPEVLAVLGCPT